MNFKQHKNYGLTIALLSSIVYCLFFTILWFFYSKEIVFSQALIEYCIVLFAITFSASQFPDLDTDSIPSKWVSRFLALWLAAVLFFEYVPIEYELQWKPAAIFTLIFLIAKQSKHRGLTHALIWVPALLIISIYTGNHFIGAFAVGLGVHYYCDGINPWKIKNWF